MWNYSVAKGESTKRVVVGLHHLRRRKAYARAFSPPLKGHRLLGYNVAGCTAFEEIKIHFIMWSTQLCCTEPYQIITSYSWAWKPIDIELY